MGALEIIGSVFIFVGCVFALTGSVGVLRMPDFYSRLHPAGKSDTLAQGMILFGLAFFAGQQLINHWPAEGGHGHGAQLVIGLAVVILKLILLTLLLFLTAPTATHAISKAARFDRYTQLAVDEDPGASRVAHIDVRGDIEEPLIEEPDHPVFNVDEDEDTDDTAAVEDASEAKAELEAEVAAAQEQAELGLGDADEAEAAEPDEGDGPEDKEER